MTKRVESAQTKTEESINFRLSINNFNQDVYNSSKNWKNTMKYQTDRPLRLNLIKLFKEIISD